MDLYLFCLCLSFGGLLLMAVLGFGHHASHGHGPGHGTHHGHARGGKASVHQHGSHRADPHPSAGLFILGLFSPRLLFSLLLGFGATGLILRALTAWPPVLLAVLAAIGGWGFEKFAVQPFWNFLFGFASRPARTLDTVVAEEGAAATDFDAAGHGLVALELDGQMRQVLGTLPPAERLPSLGRVRTGDRFVIRAVNRQRNTCTVSRLGC